LRRTDSNGFSNGIFRRVGSRRCEASSLKAPRFASGDERAMDGRYIDNPVKALLAMRFATLPRLGSRVRIPSPAPNFFKNINLLERPFGTILCFPAGLGEPGEAWGKRQREDRSGRMATLGTCMASNARPVPLQATAQDRRTACRSAGCAPLPRRLWHPPFASSTASLLSSPETDHSAPAPG